MGGGVAEWSELLLSVAVGGDPVTDSGWTSAFEAAVAEPLGDGADIGGGSGSKRGGRRVDEGRRVEADGRRWVFCCSARIGGERNE